jgi:hypothetical protein
MTLRIYAILLMAAGYGWAGGSHNTLADLVPIGQIIAGDGLWLATLKRR